MVQGLDLTRPTKNRVTRLHNFLLCEITLTPFVYFFVCTVCRVESKVESDSQSTVSVTSTWFWSPTSRVQGISWRWAWKGQRLVGWPWVVTGVRTGSQTLSWLVSHSLSESQPVTVGLPLHGTLCHLIGNLAKLSLGRISGCELKSFPQKNVNLFLLICNL